MEQNADLFVADLFHIPIADAGVDVVYTSHSLEPNGGHERRALRELLRIANHAVILVEPIYELATQAAQARMVRHGYVRNLREVTENLGGQLTCTSLAIKDSLFISETGLVYPILDGIPLLCQNHAVLASAYGRILRL
jgi:uncharacterized protein YbaR (Trm112 family)